MKNPYEEFDNYQFWKTAVSSVKSGNCFENLWQPKFQIDNNSKIITVGSCFAQNISKWLVDNNYNWVESELPPKSFSEDKAKSLGYGQFSFRTGNIYTPALLRQWIAQALGHIPNISEVFEDRNRYFDPFRPRIPVNGYKTLEALRKDQEYTFSAIKKSIVEADVFIFTLGLTEAWVNKSGYIYPACPGTIRGEYNSEQHLFVNYCYNSILDDLSWIIHSCQKINPELKFLFTVSPVPLTATATNHHVLTATNYSKAILRSAAGMLAQKYESVDYFPSYELISSPATRTNFYDENLRSIKKEGVEFVMMHFNNGIKGERGKNWEKRQEENNKQENIGLNEIDGNQICDDILLETWNKSNKKISSSDICLVGDSHLGKLSKALSELGVQHYGGMIMNGSAWSKNLFHIDSEEFFVPLEDSGARKRWLESLPFFETPSTGKTIITNIGIQTHMTINQMLMFHKEKNKDITLESFKSYFLNKNKQALSVIKEFIERGYAVLVVTDPPTRKINKDVRKNIKIWSFYERESQKIYQELGCQVFDASAYFSENKFKDIFYSNAVMRNGVRDWFHGSEEYYMELARVLSFELTKNVSQIKEDLPSIVILDNYSKLLRSEIKNEALEQSGFYILNFDPKGEVANIEGSKDKNVYQYFPGAMLGNGEPTLLYHLANSALSCTLKPKYNVSSRANNDFVVTNEELIPTISLDKIEGIDLFGALILTSQSDLLSILKNGESTLHKTLLIDIAITDDVLYDGQMGEAEIIDLVTSLGFSFYSVVPSDNSTQLAQKSFLFIPNSLRLTKIGDDEFKVLENILKILYKISFFE